MKEKACAEVGIKFSLHRPASQEETLDTIATLNADPGIHGIIVQQPLPDHFAKPDVIQAIDPRKDVDCLHPYNIGLAISGQGMFAPCTPAGIIKLLQNEGIGIAGKHAVIVGRSDIVGKPLSYMLLAQNATVTICHSYTLCLDLIVKSADILVSAVGVPHFIKGNMVKCGAVVIDVGITRLKGKLYGDVEFDHCLNHVSHITPVPGGVGPMTVATLMENCFKAWKQQVMPV